MSRCVFAVAVLLMASGCHESPTAPPPPRVVSLEITAPAPDTSVPKGAAVQFIAVARDSAGNEISNPSFIWEVLPSSGSMPYYPQGLASIDAGGKFVGSAAGFVSVRATSGTVFDIVTLYVRNPVAYIRFAAWDAQAGYPLPIEFDSLRLIAGDQRYVAPTAFDSDDALILRPPPLSLSTSNAGVATIGDDRVVHSFATGRAVITAAMEGVVAELAVPVSTASFASLGAGKAFSCGLTPAGEAICWGSNLRSQLGINTPIECFGSGNQYCQQTSDTVPVFVYGSRTFTSLSAGDRHVCALTAAGAAYCWGDDFWGQLGTAGLVPLCPVGASGPYPCSASPIPVDGGLTFQSLAAGYSHSCGVTQAGAAYCWGRNYVGQLGIGSADGATHSTPVLVSGGLTFSYVAAGAAATCGLTSAGKVYCWGSGTLLGSTPAPEECPAFSGVTYTPSPCATSPVPIASDLTWTVVTGGDPMCALAADGMPYCWGSGHPVPTLVIDAPALLSLSAGFFQSVCGVAAGNVGYCWGGDYVASRAPGQP